MASEQPFPQNLVQARALIREKGLSRQDLTILEEILKLGGTDLAPLLEMPPAPLAPIVESAQLTRLRRNFGLFLAFLHQFSDKHLGESRQAMGIVLQNSLANLGQLAQQAHHDLMTRNHEPDWVVLLLDLVAALRTMATSLGSESSAQFQEHWVAFLQESRDRFRELFQVLAEREEGQALVNRLNAQMKALNRALHGGTGRPVENIRRLEAMLESALPPETRIRAEPLLLVQHVISSLRMALFRPYDQGIHWPAVEHVRVSLQWLWNHLGWSLPRLDHAQLQQALPPEVRTLLKQLKKDQPEAFRIVARALASHFAVLSLVERMEPAASASIQERFAAVPIIYVLEAELGRLADRVYHPRVAELLPPNNEETLLLGAFLRQAVLSLLQDQATLRGLMQQALAHNDSDQLAQTLDNLRALLLSHQRQLMADLVGLFSSELRRRLFPDSPSLTEEGDRLRQRLHRLWERLSPIQTQFQLYIELEEWARLALTLSQAQNHLQAFRRSPEFLLIRTQDRTEFERLTQALSRSLDSPPDIQTGLQEGTEVTGDTLRFLEIFLLRINARVPLIRLDLNTSREAFHLARKLLDTPRDSAERPRITHRLLQTTKILGVRDPQVITLLKRWVRVERGNKDPQIPLESLATHLERLSARLDTALN